MEKASCYLLHRARVLGNQSLLQSTYLLGLEIWVKLYKLVIFKKLNLRPPTYKYREILLDRNSKWQNFQV